MLGEILGFVGDLIGGGKQKRANRKAVDAIVAGGDRAIARLGDLFQATEGQFQPFLAAGSAGMPLYTAAVTGQGFDDFQRSPGYELRKAEGQRALSNLLASKGLDKSGGALKAGIRYNQDYAANEYGDHVGRLRDLTNLYYTAARDLAGNRSGYGGNIAAIEQAKGNAIGSGFAARGDITANQWRGGGDLLGNLLGKAFSGGWG